MYTYYGDNCLQIKYFCAIVWEKGTYISQLIFKTCLIYLNIQVFLNDFVLEFTEQDYLLLLSVKDYVILWTVQS